MANVDCRAERRKPMRYEQFHWGEVFSGGKEELQRLGVAIGRAFPGESGASLRPLRVRDARGFEWRIEDAFSSPWYDFRATVRYPWWKHRSRPERQSLSHGVSLERTEDADIYRGTRDGLVALGLAAIEQFPGAEGRGKTLVTIFPDGRIPERNLTRSRGRILPGGVKTIRRTSERRFEVRIFLHKAERARRADEWIHEFAANSLQEKEEFQRKTPKMLTQMSDAEWASVMSRQIRAKADPSLQAMLTTLTAKTHRSSASKPGLAP